MREINECTAEVFRRSEKRIKERKRRRNHILMACIPFVLCITLFSTMILPAMLPVGKDKAAEDHTQDTDGAGSIACSYYSVEIKSSATKHYETVTDKLDVDRMYFAIMDVLEEPAIEALPGNTGSDLNDDSDTTGTETYVFTFKTNYGAKGTYQLTGNLLVCVETELEVHLSAEQLAEIREVFRLPN